MAPQLLPEALPIDPTSLPHEPYLRTDGEDWSGITNQKQRKTLQNRLNKRASRQRRKQCQTDVGLVTTQSAPVDIGKAMDSLTFVDVNRANVHDKRAVLHRFSEEAFSSYSHCQPTQDHLLRLIRLNVINSLTQNSAMLGLKGDWILCESISPFGVHGPKLLLAPCPPNMLPTKLQRSIPHHPWIDLFPLPQMRDNFLLAVTYKFSLDEEENLWKDLIESGGHTDWTGMIVWGAPWEPGNWEVTTGFVRKWGWLLEGCDELFEATNRWRRQRGEEPLQLNERLLQL